MNGGLRGYCDPGHSGSADSADRSTLPYNRSERGYTSDALRQQIRRNSSVDALTLAQRPPEPEPIPDELLYSQSDARVIHQWRDSRPVVTGRQVFPETMRPKYSIGSQLRPRAGATGDRFGRQPRSRLIHAETVVGDLMGQQPECPVCLESFCESEPARAPRSLYCGHTFCTGENWSVCRTLY